MTPCLFQSSTFFHSINACAAQTQHVFVQRAALASLITGCFGLCRTISGFSYYLDHIMSHTDSEDLKNKSDRSRRGIIIHSFYFENPDHHIVQQR